MRFARRRWPQTPRPVEWMQECPGKVVCSARLFAEGESAGKRALKRRLLTTLEWCRISGNGDCWETQEARVAKREGHNTISNMFEEDYVRSHALREIARITSNNSRYLITTNYSEQTLVVLLCSVDSTPFPSLDLRAPVPLLECNGTRIISWCGSYKRSSDGCLAKIVLVRECNDIVF